MEHSKKYEKVKHYYDSGLWTINMVYNAVIKFWITPEEYEEITNEQFPLPVPDGTTEDYALVGKILMGVEE